MGRTSTRRLFRSVLLLDLLTLGLFSSQLSRQERLCCIGSYLDVSLYIIHERR